MVVENFQLPDARDRCSSAIKILNQSELMKLICLRKFFCFIIYILIAVVNLFVDGNTILNALQNLFLEF